MKKEMKIEKVEQLIEGYKNIYVPTFKEWYHVNSKGYKSRNDKPYTINEAEEVADEWFNKTGEIVAIEYSQHHNN